jgi:hypothetical protein
MKNACVVFLAIGLAAACNRGRTEKVETEIETERDAAGNTVKTEAEEAGRLPGGGKIDVENKIYIGTVTEYEAGKRLKISSSDGESHSFDLAERDATVNVQPSVEQGKLVEVMIEKQKDQPKKISVMARVR